MYTPVPLQIQPGIISELTANAASGRWIEGDMVRFWRGRAERWGGWRRVTTETLDTPARASLSWRALDGRKITAFGTAHKLWLLIDTKLYDITPAGLPPGNVDGLEDANNAWGGAGTWGQGVWGGPTTSPTAISDYSASTWSLSTWGEDLVATRRGGEVYHWDYTNGTGVVAQALAGAPATNLFTFVSPSNRTLVSLGAHDGVNSDTLNIRWADRESLNTWDPLATNSAGDLRIQVGSEIVTAVPVTGGHLILTDVSAHLFRFVGGEFVFALQTIGEHNGCLGPNAAIEVDGTAYWMGDDSFYSYNGQIQQVDCQVHQRVFNDLNRFQRHKIFAGVNRRFQELVWFYPSADSIENNRFVAVNKQGEWSTGSISRTTWQDDSVAYSNPIATDNKMQILEHEVGITDEDGNEIPYLLTSGELTAKAPAVAAATPHLAVRKFVPDFQRNSGMHVLEIDARDYPQRGARSKGPYAYDGTTAAFSVRVRGSLLRLRFSGEGDFRLGDMHFLATSDGARQQ